MAEIPRRMEPPRPYMEFMDLSLKLWHNLHRFKRRIKVEGRSFVVPPGVFVPEGVWTSKLLTRYLKVREGDKVLDLGSGCGVQAVHAALRGGHVLAVDHNPRALEAVRLNALLNDVSDRVETRLGDLFEPVKGELFDLIVFSPPYIPKEPRNVLESAWRGGAGLKVVRRFINQAPDFLKDDGRIQMVYSSLGNIQWLLGAMRKRLKAEVTYRLRLPCEQIILLEAWKIE
ncbi:MAG: methyltransferase [Candidatus Bathyarchaeia archaeon]|nr:methyltransferase [Candidatus Bathyarchaeota archaeon]